jgi:hypothetical protein
VLQTGARGQGRSKHDEIAISAFSPRTDRMSCGFDGPSINGSPARTRLPSCTLTWTPRGSEYSLGAPRPSSGTMMILRRPLTMPAIAGPVRATCSWADD